jgi:hypothetical protein
MTNNRHDITEIVKHRNSNPNDNNRHDITEIVKHHNSNPDDK